MLHSSDTLSHIHQKAAKMDVHIAAKNNEIKAYNEKKRLRQEEGEQEGELEIEEEEMGPPRDIAFWEQYAYGVVDGTTAQFNSACRDALKVTINASFRINDYKNFIIPSNNAKFQLAATNWSNGASTVYNYCDFNHLNTELSKFGDYNNWEFYINFFSRFSGSMLSDIPRYSNCVAEGKAGGQGYDVGFCRGATVALLLDTKL